MDTEPELVPIELEDDASSPDVITEESEGELPPQPHRRVTLIRAPHSPGQQ